VYGFSVQQVTQTRNLVSSLSPMIFAHSSFPDHLLKLFYTSWDLSTYVVAPVCVLSALEDKIWKHKWKCWNLNTGIKYSGIKNMNKTYYLVINITIKNKKNLTINHNVWRPIIGCTCVPFSDILSCSKNEPYFWKTHVRWCAYKEWQTCGSF